MQRWVSYFAKKGHDVVVLSISDKKIDGCTHLEFNDLLPLPSPNSKWSYLLRLPPITQTTLLAGSLKLKALFDRINPDVVHGHFLIPFGFHASLFHPSICTAWGSDVYLTKWGMTSKVMLKHIFANANVITADAIDLKNAMIKLGCKEEKIVIIQFGVDTEKFLRKPDSREKIRKIFNISDDEVVVISTRHLLPVYNVDCLIKAASMLKKGGIHLRYVILGTGRLKSELVSSANRLKLQNVIFVGQVGHKEMPDYLSAADIYVSTSLSDSTSVSLLEAMACELVPVVSDISANKEWIREGQNGFLFKKGDPHELAKKLTFIISDYENITKRIGKINRRIILEKADYYKNMAKMECVYESLLNKKRH